MFKFIKELFKKEEPQLTQDVDLKNLNEWLIQKVSTLSLKDHLHVFFEQVDSIKTQLYKKIEILQNQQITEKDIKQVEVSQ